MKKRYATLAILLTLALSLFVSPMAFGTTLEDLEKQEQEQEERQKQLEQELKAQKQKKSQQQAYLKEIENQNQVVRERLAAGDETLVELMDSIGKMELEIADINFEMEALGLSIEVKENEIQKTLLELEKIDADKAALHEQAKERIRVMYEYGDTGFLDVMLASKDLMDMFSRLEYINRLVDADNDLFNSLDRYQTDIEGKETELQVHEGTLQMLSDKLEVERQALDAVVTSKNLEIEYVNELREIQRANQQVLKNQEQKAEATIDQIDDNVDAIEAEFKRVEDEISRIVAMRMALLTGDSGISEKGEILWPVPGWSRISSYFGPRLHPIHKTWRKHNGIDIPAYSGTPIIAVASGEVVLAKYSSSYGNYCVIAHGNGYASLYAHCSKLKVSVGDYVSVGDTVALVGTTGWSTGNHLHFGFQRNEQWLNPLDYIINK